MPTNAHANLSESEVHSPFRKVFVNAAARTGDPATYTADDLNKAAFQSDTNEIYILKSHSPTTWTLIAGGGGGGVTLIDDDSMVTASSSTAASSESVKAYVDNNSVIVLTAPPVDGTTTAHFIGQLFFDRNSGYLHQALTPSTVPLTAPAGSTFSRVRYGKVSQFLSATSVGAAIIATPTVVEIKAAADAASHIDCVLFYTGTDISTDPITHTYWIDEASAVVQLNIGSGGGAGDNLGNHTATTNLNMAGNTITNAPGFNQELKVFSAPDIGAGSTGKLYLTTGRLTPLAGGSVGDIEITPGEGGFNLTGAPGTPSMGDILIKGGSGAKLDGTLNLGTVTIEAGRNLATTQRGEVRVVTARSAQGVATIGQSLTLLNIGTGEVDYGNPLGYLTPSAIQTTSFTATVGQLHLLDSTGGAFIVTPPASPSPGDMFGLVDARNIAGTNAITINFAGALQNFAGAASNYTISTNLQTEKFMYIDAITGWIRYP